MDTQLNIMELNILERRQAQTRRETSGRGVTAGRRQIEAALPYLYFAYGSNLNWEQMAWRCPTAMPARRLILPNWRLEFRGVADIAPCPSGEVAGGLYTLRAGDELALDQYEGYRRGDPARGLYRKVFCRIRTAHGHARTIMFYVMNRGCLSPPGPSYLQTIRQGYEDWGLGTRSLEEAALRAQPVWDEYRDWYGDEGWDEDDLTGSLFD